MLRLWIIPGVIVFFGLIILRGSLVTIRKMPSISKPLSESDVSIYAGIIIGGRGEARKTYPFVCCQSVKCKNRTCLSCMKLEEAKSSTASGKEI